MPRRALYNGNLFDGFGAIASVAAFYVAVYSCPGRVACLLGCRTAPPVQEMSDARQAIVAAAAAGATRAVPRIRCGAGSHCKSGAHLQAQEYGRARLAALQAKHHAAWRSPTPSTLKRRPPFLTSGISMDEVIRRFLVRERSRASIFVTARVSRPTIRGARPGSKPA